MKINGYSTTGYTWGNMTRVMNTSTAADTTFGSPNSMCTGGGPGMGSGGETSNCVPLGNVLIIQESNMATATSNSKGGDIVFSFDSTVDEFDSITLFNAESGSVITLEYSDNTTSVKTIADMQPNEVQEIILNAKHVVKVTVHLNGLGAIAKIGICRDSSKTPAPIAFAPPVETMEPTSVPTTTPQPSTAPSQSHQGTTSPTGCVMESDIAYVDTAGLQVPFPEGAITVTSYGQGKVDFTVSQLWNISGEVVMLAVRNLVGYGESECNKNVNVKPSAMLNYSALCVGGYAEVGLFVYLGGSAGYNPDECDACTSPSDNATDMVRYLVEINCQPNKCQAPTTLPSPATSTTSPTGVPSASPQPTPGTVCPEDVVLLAKVGSTDYPDLPIVILEQAKTYVRFAVENTWNESVARIFTQFHDTPTGQTECFEDDNVQKHETMDYTAYCMINVPITIVDIWVSDSSFNTTMDNAVVPECCHPPSDDTNPKVQYTFKIYCVTQCPTDNTTVPAGTRRRLDMEKPKHVMPGFGHDASSGNAERTDGHYCASVDYPCGDNDEKVYICHYSAKNGYQTYCVPEPDSDIVAFYPKDYCGPCVGGYGDHSQAMN